MKLGIALVYLLCPENFLKNVWSFHCCIFTKNPEPWAWFILLWSSRVWLCWLPAAARIEFQNTFPHISGLKRLGAALYSVRSPFQVRSFKNQTFLPWAALRCSLCKILLFECSSSCYSVMSFELNGPLFLFPPVWSKDPRIIFSTDDFSFAHFWIRHCLSIRLQNWFIASI